MNSVSFTKIIIFYFALMMQVFTCPFTAAAAESGYHPPENTTASQMLDGKKFIGPTGEKGKKMHHEDVLSFSDGIFTSSACFQYGFKGGPYIARAEDDSIKFQAETVSPTHGKMVWKGILKGDTLDVIYSWTKERWLWTTFREYWFKGSLLK